MSANSITRQRVALSTYSAVPQQLKDRPNWVVWKYETRDRNETKPPLDANNSGLSYAKVNDSQTWATFDKAADVADLFSGNDLEGIGFVFTGTDFVGSDLDGVVHEDRTIDPFAVEILKLASSYCEFSPSGTGVHVIWQSSIPLPAGNRKGNKKLGGEIYDKNSPRYFTVSGNKIDGLSADSITKIEDPDKIELLHFMVLHLHDAKLTNLWMGDPSLWTGPNAKYPSQSEADQALCNLLARMLNYDAQKIEKYFSASILGQRDKWTQRKDYRERTIARALSSRESHSSEEPDHSQTTDNAGTRTITLTRGDNVKMREVSWIWKGRLVADGLNGFSGEPGVGKSTVASDIMADVTRGSNFSDGAINELGPKDVLIICDEEGREDVIVPRLKLAGADLARVWFLNIEIHQGQTTEQGGTRLDEDLPLIEKQLDEHPDIVLIVPDPVTEYLGDANPNLDQDVGPIYSKMLRVSKRHRVAWLLISHFNKDRQATSTNRTSGAKVMVTKPRCNWLFAADPNSTDGRFLMLQGKCNLARRKALAYYLETQNVEIEADGGPLVLEEINRVRWDGETSDQADDVLLSMSDPKERADTKVKAFLDDVLAEGPKRARECYDLGKAQGIYEDAFKRHCRGISKAQIQSADGHNEWWWAQSKLELDELRKQLTGGRTADAKPPDDGVLAFLEGMIGDASMPVSLLKSAAKARGLNWESVRTAHRRHGYESITTDQGRCWRKVLTEAPVESGDLSFITVEREDVF